MSNGDSPTAPSNIEIVGGVEPGQGVGYVVFQYYQDKGQVRMDEFKTYEAADAYYLRQVMNPPAGLKQAAVFKVLHKTTFMRVPGIEGKGAMGRP